MRTFGFGEWEDQVRSELFERRTIMVTGTLGDATATAAAAELMTLDATGDGPVQIHLDCAGGTLEAAATLVDVVDLMGAPVETLGLGRVEGPGFAVLAVGGRRSVGPSTSLRMREPTSTGEGDARTLGSWAAHRRQQLESLCRRLADASGRPFEEVVDGWERGRYLTPREASDLGYIDEIAVRPVPATLFRFPRRIGFHNERP